jgi:hypothetical protein
MVREKFEMEVAAMIGECWHLLGKTPQKFTILSEKFIIFLQATGTFFRNVIIFFRKFPTDAAAYWGLVREDMEFDEAAERGWAKPPVRDKSSGRRCQRIVFYDITA